MKFYFTTWDFIYRWFQIPYHFNLPGNVFTLMILNFSLPRHWFQFTLKFQLPCLISIYYHHSEISVYLITDFNLPLNFSLPRHWFQFTLKFQFTWFQFTLNFSLPRHWFQFTLKFQLPCLISIYYHHSEISVYLITDFNLPLNFSLPRHWFQKSGE